MNKIYESSINYKGYDIYIVDDVWVLGMKHCLSVVALDDDGIYVSFAHISRTNAITQAKEAIDQRMEKGIRNDNR